ncbi:hypothetical protein FRC12_013706 [Ceratobasidium sp. 428]|nr:hypothetical protein FRC12_013706 [Ceratobasidium sp. 428]
MQPHYANAYYTQGGCYTQPTMSQPTHITIPSPGFARNQPMASLIPIHMRNRVGPARCGHEGCLFAGSHKEVEVHKMDRHLIFPPGWENDQTRKKRKRGKEREGDEEYVDEEAQFRASGSVAILGTDTKLDSPEAIAAWLEERKKRWPSAKRVSEQAQTRQEALERGQIITEPHNLRRAKIGGDNGSGASSQRGRGRGRGRRQIVTQHQPGPGEGGDRGSDMGWGRRARGRGRGIGRGTTDGERGRGRGRGRGGAHPEPPAWAPSGSKQGANFVSASSSSTSTESSSDSGSDSSSDSNLDDASESDMDPVRDAVSSKVASVQGMYLDVQPTESNNPELPKDINQPASNQPAAQVKKRDNKKRAVQPPKPAYNPFDQRPDLLRSLLMPDIQATVSNLSQAIRFLVANEFLENVELKPGDAENVLVQPVSTDPIEHSTT